ncbi:hypothetical protein J1605_018139 [Eschrichtius robustus]|uniref:Uncharacterized protein n=1 Tax=Eschrichtius robustus TaxID=9764 RepID=A0AB34HWC5_ESCRO|nr:hypothetical protein J1605_018139 [Eschrichtius robustus]
MWLTGPVALWHVGSSQTRARTPVPCIGRQILNNCATREALGLTFETLLYLSSYFMLTRAKLSYQHTNCPLEKLAGIKTGPSTLLLRCEARALGVRASVVVAHGPSCSMACGIFPDQGSNPCPPHWQADSQPPRHQGSPINIFEQRHLETLLVKLTGLCGVSQWQEQSSETYLVPGPVGGQPGLTAKTCLCSRAQWAAHAGLEEELRQLYNSSSGMPGACGFQNGDMTHTLCIT